MRRRGVHRLVCESCELKDEISLGWLSEHDESVCLAAVHTTLNEQRSHDRSLVGFRIC